MKKTIFAGIVIAVFFSLINAADRETEFTKALYNTASHYVGMDYVYGAKSPYDYFSCAKNDNRKGPCVKCKSCPQKPSSCYQTSTECLKGFDCSGFIQWVYENNGVKSIKVSDLVSTQFKCMANNWYQKKKKSEELEKHKTEKKKNGDIMFFYRAPRHVGIFFTDKKVFWNRNEAAFLNDGDLPYLVNDIQRKAEFDADGEFTGYSYYYEGDVVIHASGVLDHYSSDTVPGDIVCVPAPCMASALAECDEANGGESVIRAAAE